jgi:hypothetical protein
MIVNVTKKGRNYTYDLIKDGDIVEQRVSLNRYTLCTNNGRKFYTSIDKVKGKDINKLIPIHHEGID